MGVFRSDSLTACGVYDRIMYYRVNSAREQNPLIFCKILEHDVLLLCSRVVLGEDYIESVRANRP